MRQPDYARDPWTHPAVRTAHLVRRTREGHAGIASSVATCQCGWAACVRVDGLGAAHIALDDDICDHWRSVIAEAEAVPA